MVFMSTPIFINFEFPLSRSFQSLAEGLEMVRNGGKRIRPGLIFEGHPALVIGLAQQPGDRREEESRVGDVAGEPMLAHHAVHQGYVCADAIAGRNAVQAVPPSIRDAAARTSSMVSSEVSRAAGLVMVAGP